MSVTSNVINKVRQRILKRIRARKSSSGLRGGSFNEIVGGKSARLIKAWKTRKKLYGESGTKKKRSKSSILKKTGKAVNKVIKGSGSKSASKLTSGNQKYDPGKSSYRYKPNAMGRTKRRIGGGYTHFRRSSKR